MAQPDVPPCRIIGETDQVLAPTLPFKQQDVPREQFEHAIHQTRKRWAWFAESRELDAKRGTELGTLGYLPWEIRRQILEAVRRGLVHRLPKQYQTFPWAYRQGCAPALETLCYRPRELRSGLQVHDVFDPFDLASYTLEYVDITELTRTGCPMDGVPMPIPLRLSSRTLRDDFDDLFLPNTVFKFESCAELQEFLGRLSDLQRTKLRRIVITILVHYNCCYDLSDHLPIDWRKTRSLQLPASLQQVSFDLDYKRVGPHFIGCSLENNRRLLKEIKAVAGIVEVLSKIIVRSAPGAVVQMHKNAKKELPPEHAELFDAALNDIER